GAPPTSRAPADPPPAPGPGAGRTPPGERRPAPRPAGAPQRRAEPTATAGPRWGRLLRPADASEASAEDDDLLEVLGHAVDGGVGGAGVELERGGIDLGHAPAREGGPGDPD